MYGNPNGASINGNSQSSIGTGQGGAGILQRLTSVVSVGRDE